MIIKLQLFRRLAEDPILLLIIKKAGLAIVVRETVIMDLFEGEGEDMERRFGVGFEDVHHLLHLLVDLRVTLIAQQFLKDLRELADDLDVLEGDVQLGHGLRARELDDLHKFSLGRLGNDRILE